MEKSPVFRGYYDIKSGQSRAPGIMQDFFILQRLRLVCVFLWALLVFAPSPGQAQGMGPVTGGALAGGLVGTSASVAATVLLAQDDQYVWNWSQLRGWRALPVAAGIVGGAIQGGIGSDRLGPAVGWSALGAVGGAGVGALIGPSIWGDERGRWAGLLIGAGAGAVAGWVVGTVVSAPRTEATPAASLAFSVPFGAGR